MGPSYAAPLASKTTPSPSRAGLSNRRLGSLLRPLLITLLSCLTLVAACISISPAPAGATPTWTQTFTDNFTRADGPIGGTWINTGNEAAIVNNQLSLSYNGAAPWSDTTLRPSSENQLDQRVVIDSAAGNSESSAGIFATLRYQDANNNYWAGMYNGTIWLGSVQGGNQVNFNGNGTTLSSYNPSDTYSLDFSAVGSTPTTLTAIVTDTTTDTVVGTASTTDSTAAMQQAGQSGMWFATGSSGATWVASSFTTYDDAAATSYSLSGPSSAVAGQSSGAFTVTPDGNYTGTITPSDGGAGGTFTPSSLTFSASGNPQTFTYRPASPGTVSISTTSSPGLTDPSALSLSVPAPTWTQTFTDNFTRADGPIGGTWINTGNEAAIVNNQLSLSYNGAAPWSDTTLRPSSENQLDQRVVIDSAAGNSESSAGIFATLRYQDANNNYWAGMYNGTIWLGSVQGGNQVNFNGNGTTLSSYNPSDTYSLDFSAVGSTPTTLTAIVTDTTTDTVVGTASTTDSTAAMQQAGQSGMWFATGSSGATWVASSFTTYDDAAATSYSLSGPSSAVAGQSSGAFTVTPDGNYTGTITPSDGGAGGTFTPSSLTFSASGNPQTFTYRPASPGTVSISTTSSPGLTDPSALSLSVPGTATGEVAVDNPDLVWSPYNWQFDGSSWAQTSPGGAYVKFAFTGSTLGINIDQSMLNGIDPSQMHLDAYVDGSATPITKTFADATDSGTQITFTTSLGTGDHYAVIYFAQSPFQVDRWIGPADDLRVTSLQLALDGTGDILPPAGTPIAAQPKKVIFFGDSITEGYHDTADENAYSADVAKVLGNVEYGQIAYSGAGWDISAPNNVPDFYVNAPNQSTSFWENYDSSASRLVDPANLSEGFIGGAPDAVYVNMGINDADAGAPAVDLETKMDAWLGDMRTTIGPRPEIFVIVPFNFGSGNFPTYKTDLLAGVSDYEAAHPSDTRVDVIDLGASGWDIVQANSTDGLHPDDAGAALLANQIASASAPLISAGSPTQLVFSTQPTIGSSGSAFGQPTVTIEDADGNVVSSDTNPITLTIATGIGTLTGCSATTTAGVAAFSGCEINQADTYTLTATDSTDGLTSSASSSFTISAGSPLQLVFSTQPTAGTSGSAFGQPTVTIEDADGNVVSSDTNPITLTIATGIGTLTGCSATTTAGVAAFSGCEINQADTYTLTATDSTDGLTGTSSAFNVATASSGGGSPAPTPPAAPAGSTSSASGVSTTSTGTATATNDGTTASGTGVGALTVAQYGSDPVAAPTFTSSGEDFDVALSAPNSFTSVTIDACLLSGGNGLEWFNPAAGSGAGAWEAVTPTPTFTAGPPACLSFTLNSSSSPTLVELTGTVFGVSVGTTTLTQGSATSATVADGSGFSGQLGVTNPTGALSFTETSSAHSAQVPVGSAGVIAAAGALAPGTYAVSGTDADTHGDTGTWNFTLTVSPAITSTPTPTSGYWEVAADGGVFTFGDAIFYGSEGGTHLNSPVVAMAATSDNLGYWLVASDGGIFSFGDATFFGSLGATHHHAPIVGMVATPDGKGYWLVASDGGIFSFGDATFFGSLGATHLNAPIVGMVATPDGKGYWLVAADGGIFAFGDATFYGSEGATHLNSPVVAMAATLDGHGYWLVAADGGMFAFGDATFYGSLGATHLNKPVVGMKATPDGGGYWLVASDGGIFAFGDAAFEGSEGGTHLNSPVVAIG
jgi:lysophospholipase L1-like esterase